MGRKERLRGGGGAAAAVGGGTTVDVVVLPNFIAAHCEIDQSRAVTQVDHVPDVDGHFEEKEDLLDVVQRVRSQGGEHDP